MARNVCNCIYFHIQENTSKCVVLHVCYRDVLGFYCNWGGGGIERVENLWLTSKLNSTVTMTVLITQDFFGNNYSNERRANCKQSNYFTYAPNKEPQAHFD